MASEKGLPDMHRRVLLTSAAVIASGLLAVTGCKGVSLSTSSTPGTGPAQATPNRAGSLYIEPGAGFSPVYDLIDHARHSVDVTMYEFSDSAAERDLAAAASRGVHVEVILDTGNTARTAPPTSICARITSASCGRRPPTATRTRRP